MAKGMGEITPKEHRQSTATVKVTETAMVTAMVTGQAEILEMDLAAMVVYLAIPVETIPVR
ncbi:hypothetical protein D3C76_1468870 [compost metagenome]